MPAISAGSDDRFFVLVWIVFCWKLGSDEAISPTRAHRATNSRWNGAWEGSMWSDHNKASELWRYCAGLTSSADHYQLAIKAITITARCETKRCCHNQIWSWLCQYPVDAYLLLQIVTYMYFSTWSSYATREHTASSASPAFRPPWHTKSALVHQHSTQR